MTIPPDNLPASASGSEVGDSAPWIEDDPPVPVAKVGSPRRPVRTHKGPLAMVETAFLASAASLMWLVNFYFPPGPLLRILFPLPIALVYLRWNQRAAWMSALTAGLLLAILMGPPRSLLFVMPYGLLGVQLGFLWRRRASWAISIGLGALVVSLGVFFRIWLLSLMAGEDLWGYLTAQITQFLAWGTNRLVDWGLVGLGAIGQPSLTVIQALAVVSVLLSSIVYLFTVHLAAWLVLSRLGESMPGPPHWVQAILDE
ncbi:DUF2232 domain-containing protein [Romeria aff. gracilis LEGE 07310]|uniref:DUF2232 domain-containing protein n=1 Tax=Vasconcelosia minhoensis LEGE 07310 TaxID=915328 RepID=A0A8J7DNZ3_9CYAN|nr:DUF2232 domain-containing protein [Romeria gracilis]MBE9078830.1 DUF2232 domain-containing protein [Romeria aff. gracilis LEGE 07310]